MMEKICEKIKNEPESILWLTVMVMSLAGIYISNM
jgi:hypothetical protein